MNKSLECRKLRSGSYIIRECIKLNDVTILWRKGSINHGQKITKNISVRTLYTCIHKDMTTYPVSVRTHHIITINTHKYTVLAGGGGCARVSVLRLIQIGNGPILEITV